MLSKIKTALVMAVSLYAAVSIAGEGHSHGPAHWGYSGETSPAQWAELDAKYATCGQGKKQSPIDISSAKVSADLPPIKVNYQTTPLHVVNNGHTIQVNVAPGSTMEVDGKTYQLLQFHFHSPSEHTIGGKPLDMVAHLVHKTKNGQLGVIAVLMKKGGDNDIIKKVWSHLPKGQGENKQADVKINAADLLPANLAYFNYKGSLTTPPCSEGVNWMVLVNPARVGGDQIATFTNIFPKSARPVQPLNGRVTVLAQ